MAAGGGGFIAHYRVGYATLASPTVFTEISEISDFQFVVQNQNEIDRSIYNTALLERKIPGGITVQSAKCTLCYDPDPATTVGANHEAVRVLATNRTKVHWRIERAVDLAFTNYRGVEFDGYAKGFSEAGPRFGGLDATFEISFDDTSLTYDAAVATSQFDA